MVDLHPDWVRAMDQPMDAELALSIIDVMNNPDERALVVAAYAEDQDVALMIIGEAGKMVAHLDPERTTEPMVVFSYLAYLAGINDLAVHMTTAILEHHPDHPVARTTWMAAQRQQDSSEQKSYLSTQLPYLEAVALSKRVMM